MMKLKELREEQGLSQKKLAENIGTSQRNIGRWENEENEPTMSQLVKLAEYFNCSIDFLVDREDDYGNTLTKLPSLTSKEQKLLKYFALLDDEEKDKIIGDVEFYANRSVRLNK